jgi:hypothetical protein
MPAGAGISRKQASKRASNATAVLEKPGAGSIYPHPILTLPARAHAWRASQKEAAMEVRKRSDANEEAGSDPSPDSSRIFGTMVDAGSGCYLRA